MQLTIVGLGPGSWGQVTLEAREALEAATEVHLRTVKHPTVEHLPNHLAVHSFDHHYQDSADFQEVYQAIVDDVMELAVRPQGAIYCVPGHPLVGEATVVGLMERCNADGVPLRVISGLSFMEPTLTALGVDALATGIQIVDCFNPKVDPSAPALIAQVYDRAMASALKLSLLELYPPEHPVTQVSAAGVPALEEVRQVPLSIMDHGDSWDYLSCLYLPALPLEQNMATFDGLARIVARLHAPDGCPWDRAQSHSSLRPYLLEETYEALEALDSGDVHRLSGELGDLMLNILMHAQIAYVAGEFDIRDVVRGIAKKLVSRHPHVFGDLQLNDARDVVANWESFKEKERGAEQSILDGVAKSLPALAYSREVIGRAVSMGLQQEVESGTSMLESLGLKALIESRDSEERSLLLGSLLFHLVTLAHDLELDCEGALRESNSSFYSRFRSVERLASAEETSLSSASVERRRELWKQAEDVQ